VAAASRVVIIFMDVLLITIFLIIIIVLLIVQEPSLLKCFQCFSFDPWRSSFGQVKLCLWGATIDRGMFHTNSQEVALLNTRPLDAFVIVDKALNSIARYTTMSCEALRLEEC
jgi:hypothetical protein